MYKDKQNNFKKEADGIQILRGLCPDATIEVIKEKYDNYVELDYKHKIDLEYNGYSCSYRHSNSNVIDFRPERFTFKIDENDQIIYNTFKRTESDLNPGRALYQINTFKVNNEYRYKLTPKYDYQKANEDILSKHYDIYQDMYIKMYNECNSQYIYNLKYSITNTSISINKYSDMLFETETEKVYFYISQLKKGDTLTSGEYSFEILIRHVLK